MTLDKSFRFSVPIWDMRGDGVRFSSGLLAVESEHAVCMALMREPIVRETFSVPGARNDHGSE